MIEIVPNWHPVFVHLTIGLLSASTLLFVIGYLTGRDSLTRAAHINLWLGAILTVGTVIAGFNAYGTVAHDAPSHAAMTNHKNWALPTAGLFMLLAMWSAMIYRQTIKVGLFFLLCIVVATGILTVTGLKGTAVVYRYGLGVMSLPEVHEDGGHGSHPHGEEAVDGHHGTVLQEVKKVPHDHKKAAPHRHVPPAYEEAPEHDHRRDHEH